MLMLVFFFVGGAHAEAPMNYMGDEMKHAGSSISFVPKTVDFSSAGDLRTVATGSDQSALISHSFTDQFLEFLRQRRLAVEAANQFATEGEETEDEDWEDEYYGDRVEGDVTILHDRGGERRWRFYRPDPLQVGRSTTMQVHVQAHHTLEDVELQIVQHWADLRLPTARWRLLAIHETITDSMYLEEGHEAYMVEVNSDLQPGQVPIMFEYQYWDLTQNRFYGILEPRVHSGLMRGISLMFRDVRGHECHKRPCFSNLNGGPLEAFEEYTVYGGDYIVVSGISTARETLRIIGYWSPYADARDVPLTQAFSRTIGLNMRSDFISMEKGQANAVLLQRNMVQVYHDLQRTTNVDRLRQGTILMIAPADGYDPAEVHPVRMNEVQWGTRRSFEFPLLLEALVEADMMEHHWDGNFIEPHHTIFALTLPATLNPLDQVAMIRPPHDMVPEVAILAEFRVEGTPQDQERYGHFEIVMAFVRTPATMEELLQCLHLGRECAEYDCLVPHNERVLTMRNRPVNVADGDIVRVWYSVPVHQNLTNSATNTIQEDEVGEADVDVTMAPNSDTTARSSSTPQYLPGTLHHSLLWVGWLGCKLWKWLTTLPLLHIRGGRRNRQGCHPHTVMIRRTRHFFGKWSWLFGVTLLTSTSAFSLKGSTRFGEAQHPGPKFWIGTANPSGIVGKERQLAELPEGIWGITETHLSGVNQKAAIRKIQHEARVQGRNLQCVPGAPLPVRARSTSAGTWSGVMTLSDWTSKPVICLWPNGEHNIGRVQMVQSFYGPFSMMGATMYGWPKSPTWPNALRDTNLMFDTLVQELGLSRGGPRYIVGDFNHDLDALRGWEVLQRAGWKDAQDLAYEWWGREHCMTYRSASITDHVLLSPEMISLVADVQCWDWFADHSGIGACLEVPIVKLQQRVWPLPAEVPWDSVRYEEWRQAQHHLPDSITLNPEQRVSHWAKAYENSFDGFMDSSIGNLPTSCRGRCQQKEPVVRAVDCPLLKPSRPGEVQIKTDFVGRAVHRWFQQLRRIQSMVHAKNADKDTPDAIEYRSSLWRAIRKAKGFEGTFEIWWRTRPTQLAGLPEEFPSEPPTAACCQAIFEDFHTNYRNFQSWHARRRRNLITAQFQANTNKIFEVTRKEPRGGVNYLEKATLTTILGCNVAQSQIHVDLSHELQLPASFKVLEKVIPISAQDGQVLTLDGEWILQNGIEAEIIEHASTADKLHQQLIEFWKPRWWHDPMPKPEEWSRIINFAKAYLPPGRLDHVDISVESWMDINRRYGPRAARGPDGLSHSDLRKMPSQFQEELVNILNQCEEETVWPEVWRTGFVHSLEKKEGASRVNEYRPVIIYSVIYRSWGSLRARRFLQHLSHLVDERQLGFMPGKEVAEIWMLLQGMVERSVQEGEELMGFVTDIKKAFESLPRDPIFEIAQHLGLPAKTMHLWKHFLDTTERRFLVRGEVSEAVFSNHGFPEGCSLSCVAMSIAGITLHSYMNEFSKRCGTISYVDNLELLARALGPLQQGVLTMQTWTEMWKLELDQEKSYIWTSEAGTRKGKNAWMECGQVCQRPGSSVELWKIDECQDTDTEIYIP